MKKIELLNSILFKSLWIRAPWKLALIVVGAGLLFSCNNSKSSGKNSAAPINDRDSDQGNENSEIGNDSGDKAIKNEGPMTKSSEGDPNMASGDGTPGATPTPKAPEIPAKYGFRNFESAHSTMSALTGIPKSNAAVVTAFNANKVSLLTDPSAKGLTSSSVVALYKLSTTYCDALVKDTALRATVFGTFDFAGLPQTVLNDDGKKLIAEALVTKFWGKDLARLPPHEANVAAVKETITELLTMNTANTAATTVRVVSGACAAALMASEAMLY